MLKLLEYNSENEMEWNEFLESEISKMSYREKGQLFIVIMVLLTSLASCESKRKDGKIGVAQKTAERIADLIMENFGMDFGELITAVMEDEVNDELIVTKDEKKKKFKIVK